MKSLYKNVPLKEAWDIALRKLYEQDEPPSFARKTMRRLWNMVVRSLFQVQWNLWPPIDLSFPPSAFCGGWRAFTSLLLPWETGYVATRLVQANYGGTYLLKIIWVRSAGGGGLREQPYGGAKWASLARARLHPLPTAPNTGCVLLGHLNSSSHRRGGYFIFFIVLVNLLLCFKTENLLLCFKTENPPAIQIANAACLLGTLNCKIKLEDFIFIFNTCVLYFLVSSFVSLLKKRDPYRFWLKGHQYLTSFFIIITSISRKFQGFWLEYGRKRLQTVTSATMILLTFWLIFQKKIFKKSSTLNVVSSSFRFSAWNPSQSGRMIRRNLRRYQTLELRPLRLGN